MSNLFNTVILAKFRTLFLVVLVFFILLAFSLMMAWGIWGNRIPTRVQGGGLFLAEGGDIYAVTASFTGGRITDILVKPGDRIEKGQVIAYLDHPEQAARLNLEKTHLEYLKSEQTRLKDSVEKEKLERYQDLERQRQDIIRAQEINAKNLEDIQKVLNFKEDSLKKGFVTVQDIEITRRDYYETKERLENLQFSLKQLKTQTEDFNGEWQQRLQAMEFNVLSEKLKVETLQAELDVTREVISPVMGFVINVHTPVGKTISNNEAILSIASEGGEGLDVMMFLLPKESKQIEVGMVAYTFPDNLKGNVLSISQLPSSSGVFLAILNHPEWVKQFIEKGPPMVVRVRISDPNYGKKSLKLGTSTDIQIIVREERPLKFIISKIRNYFFNFIQS